ncbi:hypothetical protein [Massilia sp. S19_KUP03_FR1]|uniref:hypothetical protein n=1 Tax=Massilia sp. S19_KUP03_FR1 TaxID=3025503 RepID=UPI002FCDA6F7
MNSQKALTQPFLHVARCLMLGALLHLSTASAADVALAGFAYAGDLASSAARFPVTKQLEASLGPRGINVMLDKAMQGKTPDNFTLVPRIESLAGRDQAVAVALVMTSEMVSTEEIGGVVKLTVQLRGQAMFFDFKSKTVLRAYPLSFAYLDVLAQAPTQEQIAERMLALYQGTNGKPGILARFATAVNRASLPANVPRFVQVGKVTIGDEARAAFPPELANGAGEAWIADMFGEALSAKLGIPILPYAKGYAIGNVMSMTIGDSTVFNLKLPEPDYVLSADVVKLKKIVYSEQAAGKSFVYGTQMDLRLEEPMSGKAYLHSLVKNGEVKVVSAHQTTLDDFPAYEDAMRGLFTKLARAIGGEEAAWLKSAAAAPDINQQMTTTRDLLLLCK